MHARISTEYRAAIDRVTSHIHAHINDDFALSDLAGVAGFSPFHFHRVFASMTGETVSEYVRRVRLAAAVQRLLHSTEPVTTIALTSGFKTPAAFAKAFRLRLGVSPTALRKMERSDAYELLLQEPAMHKPSSKQFTPEIRALPDQRVLYARGWGIVDYKFFLASRQAFATLTHYLHQHGLQDGYTSRIGITPDDLDTVPHEQCRFDAGVVLKPGVAVKQTREVKVQVLPAGRWAIFQHKGAYDTLWHTWTVAYRDWLPRSGERPRDVPPVEVYLNNFRDTPPEALRTEIHIPIA